MILNIKKLIIFQNFFDEKLIEKREKIFDQQLADQNDNFYNIRANEEKYSKTPKIMIDCLLHGHKIDGTFTRKDIEDHVLTMISAVSFFFS